MNKHHTPYRPRHRHHTTTDTRRIRTALLVCCTAAAITAAIAARPAHSHQQVPEPCLHALTTAETTLAAAGTGLDAAAAGFEAIATMDSHELETRIAEVSTAADELATLLPTWETHRNACRAAHEETR